MGERVTVVREGKKQICMTSFLNDPHVYVQLFSSNLVWC